jgi:excinuclease ABC subunit A
MSETNIIVKGARVNNLKNISVVIPRNQFTVITGLSGSGKSSLAFDTLYAEGRRRYVESLSAYARQFMGKMVKPECDFIRGLPPAIAIEQKVNTRNPRSTVGTSTEIYDYLRMLFGRIGKTFSPISGELVKKHGVEDVLATAASYPVSTRIAVVAPINLAEGRTLKDQLDIYVKEGFSRIVVNNEFIQIEDAVNDKKLMKKTSGIDLLIDRLAVAEQGDEVSRLADSTETAFFEGNECCALLVWEGRTTVKRYDFSKRFEADGMTFPEPSDLMFNFNNPYGACPRCEGFGNILGISERLVIPNPSLSLYADAVAPWRGPTLGEWKRRLIAMAPALDFPIHRAYEELTDEQRSTLWHGKGEFPGIDGFFKWVEDRRDKIQYRVLLSRYRGKTVCPDCGGSRLRREASYVRIADKTMPDLVKMPIIDLLNWFKGLQLDEQDSKIASRLMVEITNRLTFLDEVGLGYLTLDRLSNTLSGGESQRINLATSLGSSLVGSLYILDEPSIGLHSRDTERLISVLRKLQRLGNTVVVVEHDEEIIRAADNIIDVGPDAGRLGGEIVYQGPVNQLDTATKSYTLKYLNGTLKIATPKIRRKWNSYIEVVGAAENNLKHINVRFPLGVMTVVTGVSGSGKSTLVRDILYNAIARRLDIEADAPGRFDEIRGDLHRISDIVFVDQNPIGKSSRSNPATYLKAYDEIRALYASQQSAKQMGFSPAYFSFNTEGGRCEECKGDGKITIEMQFLADVTLTCEACHGERFKRDVLEVRYRDRNINDILNMTVNQAIEFFGEVDQPTERRIVRRLQPLKDVGLGYIKLGQSSSTLSGGENQRVKLAYFLSEDKPQPTMFIFDEPTTGLHFHDINVLMESFNRLISLGHTLVIIEHNMDVIKCADHIIDIGPEGGADGGNVVVTGTPEEVVKCPQSYTGKYLKEHL